MVSDSRFETLEIPRYQTRAQVRAEEMDQQLAELTKAIQKIQVQNDAIHAAVEEIKPAVLDLQKWKPQMEKGVEELRSEMGELRTQVSQIGRNPVLQIRPDELPPILPTPAIRPQFVPTLDVTPMGKDENSRIAEESELGMIGRRESSAYRGKTIGENFFSHTAYRHRQV